MLFIHIHNLNYFKTHANYKEINNNCSTHLNFTYIHTLVTFKVSLALHKNFLLYDHQNAALCILQAFGTSCLHQELGLIGHRVLNNLFTEAVQFALLNPHLLQTFTCLNTAALTAATRGLCFPWRILILKCQSFGQFLKFPCQGPMC